MNDPTRIDDPTRSRVLSLIADHVRWLQITPMENDRGSYDVVLRLDGSYTNRSDAGQVAEFFLDQIQDGGQLCTDEPRGRCSSLFCTGRSVTGSEPRQ